MRDNSVGYLVENNLEYAGIPDILIIVISKFFTFFIVIMALGSAFSQCQRKSMTRGGIWIIHGRNNTSMEL